MISPHLNRYRSSKYSQQGFSLLETLVAFAILVLVLAVTFQIYASGTRSARLSHDYAEAVVIAQSRLAEFQAGDTRLKGKQNDRYQWQIEKQEANYNDLGMTDSYQRSFIAYDVEVTVSWYSAGKQRKVHIDTVQLVNKK